MLASLTIADYVNLIILTDNVVSSKATVNYYLTFYGRINKKTFSHGGLFWIKQNQIIQLY